MSRPANRLLASARCQLDLAKQHAIRPSTRAFSTSIIRRQDPVKPDAGKTPAATAQTTSEAPPTPSTTISSAPSQPSTAASKAIPNDKSNPLSAMERLSASLSSRGPLQAARDSLARAMNQPASTDKVPNPDENISASLAAERATWGDEPFHFHVYAHKHNTHITVTKPNRNAIISVSAGQIGFRKSKRGSYDAAYQLCAYVMDKLHQGNWHHNMTKLEVVLRGFSNGREAATKVILGSEGRLFRNKIVRVTDATRLKFGGTRSHRPRRLG